MIVHGCGAVFCPPKDSTLEGAFPAGSPYSGFLLPGFVCVLSLYGKDPMASFRHPSDIHLKYLNGISTLQRP